jgi:hypothetical protein
VPPPLLPPLPLPSLLLLLTLLHRFSFWLRLNHLGECVCCIPDPFFSPEMLSVVVAAAAAAAAAVAAEAKARQEEEQALVRKTYLLSVFI